MGRHVDVSGQPAYVYGGGNNAAALIGGRPVVVFIHGAAQDHSCWALQSRWFAHHGYAVVVPDLPGHGRSGGVPLASIEALAAWIGALLDALGIARATLVGHSMGALVALATTLAYPARIARLALLGCALPMPVSALLLDAAQYDEERAVALINAYSYSPSSQFGGSSVPGLWLLGASERLMARQKRGVLAVDLGACNAYANGIDSLALIDVPLLVIGGDADRMTPVSASRALAAAVPGARLQVIAGSGHALMAERPDAVLDVLREFFVSTA